MSTQTVQGRFLFLCVFGQRESIAPEPRGTDRTIEEKPTEWAFGPICPDFIVPKIERLWTNNRSFQEIIRMVKKAMFAALICAITGLTIYEASAAVRFKRFEHCPEGLVSKKTCECHAGSSGRFHFCHAGKICDTIHGLCHKQSRVQ